MLRGTSTRRIREKPAELAKSAGGLYTTVANKYYVDEFYGATLVKPILLASDKLLWKGVDVALIDGALNGSAAGAQETSRGVGHMQSGNIRSYAGWVAVGAARRDRLHGVRGGGTMNHLISFANDHILTLVTFLPGLGATLLLFFPRRDRDIRWFALLISLLTFLASLHLAVALTTTRNRASNTN